MEQPEIIIYHPEKTNDKKSKIINKKLPQVPFRALLCGYSGSGKSNIIKNFLFNTKWGYGAYFDTIIIICGSNDDVNEYTRIAEKTNVPMWWDEKERFYKSKKELLSDKMIITQTADEQDIKDILTEIEANHPENATLLVLDDMVVDKLFRNKMKPNIIDEIYVRGRHIGKGISVLISTQKYMMISQNIRYTNSTQLFLYFGMSAMDLDLIARENGYEYSELLQLIDNLAPEKFMFMIINQKAPREKQIQDMKFRYVKIENPE